MTIVARDWGRLAKEVIAEEGYSSVTLWCEPFCPTKLGAVVCFKFNEGTEKNAFEILIQIAPDSDMKEEIRRKLADQMKNRIH